MNEVLTTRQVADELKIHINSVRKYIKQGRLRAAKFGKMHRVRRTDLEDFLNSLS